MSSFLSDQSVDHRLIDFDVFSNTQAETFGSKVTGCSATETNGILAGVDVEFGLSSRSSGTPSRLLYEMNLDSQGRGASTTSPISTGRDFSSGFICERC